MSVPTRSSREAGVVGLVLLGLIVGGIAVAMFFFVARAQKDKQANVARRSTF